MDQSAYGFELDNHNGNEGNGDPTLVLFQNPRCLDNFYLRWEMSVDQVVDAYEFKQYYDKDDYENLNLLNWDSHHHQREHFKLIRDFEPIEVHDHLKREKSQYFNLPDDFKLNNCYSKAQSDQISVKSQHSDKESTDEKIVEAVKLEKDSTTTRKCSETYENKLDKVGDESYSSESVELSNKLGEESLVFLIRKIDRKTNKSILLTKHRKKITKCSHVELEYYAKGMCKNCYHNKGTKSKKAFKCVHHQRDHYAKGLCKNCYLHFFHIKKKQRKESTTLSFTIQE